MPTSPNMGLSTLTPGVTTGPGWATSLEADKLLLDAHTHVSGQGLPVPSAGLNINAALPFGNHAATGVSYLGLQSQATTSSGTLASALQNSAGDLYWNNASSIPVRITNGNTINVSAFGGITNLAGTTGALTYSAALQLFIATSNTNLSAGWDGATVTIRELNKASAKGITLASPANLASDYTVTLPASGLSFSNTPGAEILLNTFGTNYTPAHFLTIGDGVNTFGDWNGNNEVPFQQANQWATVTPNAASGVMVLVKRGGYNFANPLIVTATGLQFVGESRNGTRVVGKPGSATDTALVTLSGSFQGWSNMTVQPDTTAPVRTHGLMTAVTASGCVVRDNVINVQNAGFTLGAAIEMHGSNNQFTGNHLTAAFGSANAAWNLVRGVVDTYWSQGANNAFFISSGNMVTGNRVQIPGGTANLVYTAFAATLTQSGAAGALYSYVNNNFSNNTVEALGSTMAQFFLMGINTRSTVAGHNANAVKNAYTGNVVRTTAAMGLGTIARSAASPVGPENVLGNLVINNVLPSGNAFAAMTYSNVTTPALYGANSLVTNGLGKFFIAATSGGAVNHQITDSDLNADM